MNLPWYEWPVIRALIDSYASCWPEPSEAELERRAYAQGMMEGISLCFLAASDGHLIESDGQLAAATEQVRTVLGPLIAAARVRQAFEKEKEPTA